MLFERILVAACSVATALWVTPAVAEDAVARGKYLTAIMDCGGCHTDGALAGKPDPALALAGSMIGFELPGLGIFHPSNLTPDDETGLGRWSEDDIMKALKTGVRPDGRELVPIMPWRSFSALTDEDARAIAKYLKSVPPVHHAVPQPLGPSEHATHPYMTVVTPQ